MTFGSLFAGIGGMDLGLERAGMTCKWQVEIDPFCQRVLTKHWPEVPKYGDIRAITGAELERVDLIAGGFPCQDLSVAGRRAGIDGERSGLWREYARLIGDIRPRYVLIENVSGLLANESMRRVLGDLSALGYDAEWESIPAASVGAPTIRDRVWILANTRQKSWGAEGRIDDFSRRNYVFQKTDDRTQAIRGTDWQLVALAPGVHQRSSADWWARQSGVARSINGVPRELVDARNGALGNAVVPQVAEWIGRRIMGASL
jgi:DNA (cytosine-5)-methyltransferase 1